MLSVRLSVQSQGRDEQDRSFSFPLVYGSQMTVTAVLRAALEKGREDGKSRGWRGTREAADMAYETANTQYEAHWVSLAGMAASERDMFTYVHHPHSSPPSGKITFN